MAPNESVTRSSTKSWNATRTPSEVRCTSVSRWSKPTATAASNARSVFSGADSVPPRCAMAMGPGVSR